MQTFRFERRDPYPVLVNNIHNDHKLSIGRAIVHHGDAADLHIATERLQKKTKTGRNRTKRQLAMAGGGEKEAQI